MNVRERLLALRLKEKLEADAAYAAKIGIEITVPPPTDTAPQPVP